MKSTININGVDHVEYYGTGDGIYDWSKEDDQRWRDEWDEYEHTS